MKSDWTQEEQNDKKIENEIKVAQELSNLMNLQSPPQSPRKPVNVEEPSDYAGELPPEPNMPAPIVILQQDANPGGMIFELLELLGLDCSCTR